MFYFVSFAHWGSCYFRSVYHNVCFNSRFFCLMWSLKRLC